MKRSIEIVGLPVLSIIKGREVGTVKELLIDPNQGEVAFLLLGLENWYSPPGVLPFKDVSGVGEYALTIEYDNSITPLGEIPEAAQLLANQVKVIGTKVITRKGKYIGKVTEIIIDDANGKISGCVIEPKDDPGASPIIPDTSIITFGQEVLVINEEAATGSSLEAPPAAPPATPVVGTPVPTAPAPVPPAPATNGVNGMKLFEERQRQSVIGKKLVRTILDDQGQVIAAEGETVTEELLERIEKLGKFVELSMGVER
ncbi:MAG: hypothetical protein HPY50_00225 [Firmicutes bacterium]|nr:hypothetical protein [Bacillota bacterium]